MLVRRPHLVREQAGARDLVRVRDLGDHSLDCLLADAGLVEVAQVPHECHHAHRRDDRLPRLGVHAARQPARQPLPRETGARERVRTALAQRRAPRVDCDRVELRGGSQYRQDLCVGARVVVMTAVEQPAEQRRLRVVARRRVDQLDHVGHADLTREAVVAQRRALRVQAPHGVGDAALDRHRDVAAVRREPVAEHLSRLVRPLECGSDHGATVRATRGDVLGSHDDRGRPHQHRGAQVRDQARDERRVRRRDLAHERDEARVARVGALVERVLAHHVRSREQEQVRLGVARVRRAALVRERARSTRADRRHEVDPQRTPLRTRELRHDVVLFRVRSVRSGNSANERRRFERQGREALHAREGSPSFAADRSCSGRSENQAAEDTGALPIELRRERRRDSNPQPPCKQKEPPSAQRTDSNFKERDNGTGIVVLRAQVSNPVLLVQSQVWFPIHQLAPVMHRWVWTERFELPTSGFRCRRAASCASSSRYSRRESNSH